MVLSPFKACPFGVCLARSSPVRFQVPSLRGPIQRIDGFQVMRFLGSRVEKLIAPVTDGWQEPVMRLRSTQDHPAVTAFALMALKGAPSKTYDDPQGSVMAQGYAFLDRHIQPDGGIYHIGLVTYNTAICMMALSVSGQDHHEDAIRKARQLSLVAE